MKAIILVCLIALTFAATNTTSNATNATKAIEAKLQQGQLTPTAAAQLRIAANKKREAELIKEIAEDAKNIKALQEKFNKAQEEVKKAKATPVPEPVPAKTATTLKQVVKILQEQEAKKGNQKPAAPAMPMTEQEKKLAAELNSIEQEEQKIRRVMRELRRKREEAKRQKEREAELAKFKNAVEKAEAAAKHAAADLKAAQVEVDGDAKELAAVQAAIKKDEVLLQKLAIEVKLQAANKRKGELVQEIVNDVNRINRENNAVGKARENLKKVQTAATKAAAKGRPAPPAKPVEIKTVEKVSQIIKNPFASEFERKLNDALEALELKELKIKKQLREAERLKAKEARMKKREAELKKQKTELDQATLALKHAEKDVVLAQQELDKDISELTEVQTRIKALEGDIAKLPK